ncbi:hypothetical protein L1987_07504 [Smallanthus sonchifolius]|uniref:Uncharacterized protein n=1 Tax=Smallanthus sonchifolius TaxID=185202 RepID=A0ACB9K0S7_9ASTR|nr:hypothetical protein L1987_07504 [Smallanthus sonchifolius]
MTKGTVLNKSHSPSTDIEIKEMASTDIEIKEMEAIPYASAIGSIIQEHPELSFVDSWCLNRLSLTEILDRKQRPLLIVAEDVESDALATLILNKLRAGIKVCAIKAPGFGDNRKTSLQHLATLTGGQFWFHS